MEALYTFENSVLQQLRRDSERGEKLEIQFNELEALTAEFKTMLLAILARRKKENLRSGEILTVSHPDMEVDEQIPFLAERSEVPAITVRPCTPEDREQMYSLREVFPDLLDAHNAVGSSFAHKPELGYFYDF
jgi:hypothetical protein